MAFCLWKWSLTRKEEMFPPHTPLSLSLVGDRIAASIHPRPEGKMGWEGYLIVICVCFLISIWHPFILALIVSHAFTHIWCSSMYSNPQPAALIHSLQLKGMASAFCGPWSGPRTCVVSACSLSRCWHASQAPLLLRLLTLMPAPLATEH